MNKIDNVLAYYIYPLPNGTSYYESDLISEYIVIEVFDYCQIHDCIIYKEGWDFLINTYGYDKLYKLDKKSSYLDSETLEDYIKDVNYQKEFAIRNN